MVILVNSWPIEVLVALLAARVGLDAWWLSAFRFGYPLNTDEVGYLTAALDDTRAFTTGGFVSLWQAFTANRLFAPLVPLLTVPIHLLFGPKIFPSFFVQTPFVLLLGLASYGLTSRLANPRLGLLAAFVVISIPDMTDWARAFHFGVPSAALFTAAAYALVRSEGLGRRPWVLIWGLLLGLTLLARTLMIALVPGQIVAAILVAASAPLERRKRFESLGLALVLGSAVAGTWYSQSWTAVAEYLVTFGYGSRSVYYGRAHSFLSWDRWSATMTTLVNHGLYLPLAVVVALTLVVGAGMAICRSGQLLAGGRWRMVLQDGVWISALVTVCGCLALTSTQNEGTGFAHPLLPILVALAMAVLSRLSWRFLRTCLVTAFIVASGFDMTMKADLIPAFSGTWSISVPGFGGLLVSDGRGDIQRQVFWAGYDTGPVTSSMPELLKRWQTLGCEIVGQVSALAADHKRQPVVVYASRDPFYNGNFYNLSARLCLGRQWWAGQIEASRGGDNDEAYRAQLTDPQFGQPNLVITADRGPDEFPPYVTQTYVENAARSLGFHQVYNFWLPDGRELRMWWLDRGAVL